MPENHYRGEHTQLKLSDKGLDAPEVNQLQIPINPI
jgi:hypothetical protein